MPKLPKGMFRRGGPYSVRLHEDGCDHWISLGPEYGEACRKLAAMRRGEIPARGGSTVAEVAKRWLETYVRSARNEKKQIMAATRADRYLGEFFRYRPLSNVGPNLVREYRHWLEAAGLKPMTVAHVLSDARCLFNWCVDSGLLDRSPFPRRVMPRLQERPPDRLTDDEVAAALAVEEPHGFVVRLGLATGLRSGELTRAETSHVEQGMLVVSQTKSGRIRRVPLPPELLAEIRGRVGRLVRIRGSRRGRSRG
jgi:integrase